MAKDVVRYSDVLETIGYKKLDRKSVERIGWHELSYYSKDRYQSILDPIFGLRPLGSIAFLYPRVIYHPALLHRADDEH
jgi:hypothetical protein